MSEDEAAAEDPHISEGDMEIESDPFEVVTDADTEESELESIIPVSIEEIQPDEEDKSFEVTESSDEDMEFEDRTRDFSADFDLAEPEPLITDSDEVSIEEEAELPSFEDEPDLDDSEIPEVPTFTPPKSEPWSPYDEPSIPSDDLENEEDDILEKSIEEDEDEEASNEDSTDRIAPPPPPPPPETDETEEERRRKAR
ncbi:MAG: hypothetical protein ACFE7R_10190, partial [Candidatus Hodarchaeota archaeon]